MPSSAPARLPAARGAAPHRGAWLREVWRSSVGKKVIVAITGAVLLLYIVLHVLGNLKAFQGDGDGGGAPLDTYAGWLRDLGSPAIPHEGVLWVLRVVLIASLVIHVTGVVQLAARNQRARPAGHNAAKIQRSFAAQTMLWGGLALLGFTVFHILHLTVGAIEPGSFRDGAVYANLAAAFDNPLLVAVYVAASALIALHVYHGFWSAIQTAGWDKPNRNPTFRRASTATTALVAVGFAAVPIAFWTGIL